MFFFQLEDSHWPLVKGSIGDKQLVWSKRYLSEWFQDTTSPRAPSFRFSWSKVACDPIVKCAGS